MTASPSTRRVFIGIKLSDDLANVCLQLQSEWSDLPARFAKHEDLHLTLVPPFDMEDEDQVDACINPIIQRTQSFTLQLRQLEFGPTPDDRRLAWIICEAAPELVELREALVHAFDYKDRYSFRPHITLARFNKKDHHVLAKRSIQQVVDHSMEVQSVELFESVHRQGVTYRILNGYAF